MYFPVIRADVKSSNAKLNYRETHDKKKTLNIKRFTRNLRAKIKWTRHTEKKFYTYKRCQISSDMSSGNSRLLPPPVADAIDFMGYERFCAVI